MKWLTIEEYCRKHDIGRSGYYKRVSSGLISKDRLGKNESGKVIIKPEEDNNLIDVVYRLIRVIMKSNGVSKDKSDKIIEELKEEMDR